MMSVYFSSFTPSSMFISLLIILIFMINNIGINNAQITTVKFSRFDPTAYPPAKVKTECENMAFRILDLFLKAYEDTGNRIKKANFDKLQDAELYDGEPEADFVVEPAIMSDIIATGIDESEGPKRTLYVSSILFKPIQPDLFLITLKEEKLRHFLERQAQEEKLHGPTTGVKHTAPSRLPGQIKWNVARLMQEPLYSQLAKDLYSIEGCPSLHKQELSRQLEKVTVVNLVGSTCFSYKRNKASTAVTSPIFYHDGSLMLLFSKQFEYALELPAKNPTTLIAEDSLQHLQKCAGNFDVKFYSPLKGRSMMDVIKQKDKKKVFIPCRLCSYSDFMLHSAFNMQNYIKFLFDKGYSCKFAVHTADKQYKMDKQRILHDFPRVPDEYSNLSQDEIKEREFVKYLKSQTKMPLQISQATPDQIEKGSGVYFLVFTSEYKDHGFLVISLDPYAAMSSGKQPAEPTSYSMLPFKLYTKSEQFPKLLSKAHVVRFKMAPKIVSDERHAFVVFDEHIKVPMQSLLRIQERKVADRRSPGRLMVDPSIQIIMPMPMGKRSVSSDSLEGDKRKSRMSVLEP